MRLAGDGVGEEIGKRNAGVDGFRRSMRRPALAGGGVAPLGRIVPVADGDGRKTHQGSVADAVGRRRARDWVIGDEPSLQRRARRWAHAETTSSA